MDLFLPNFTQTSARLSQQLEATVDDVIDTTTDDAPSDRNAFKEDVQRWRKVFRNVVDDVHQKGYLLEDGNSEANSTIFTVLTSGMEKTLDGIREAQTAPAQNNPLRIRIVYHTHALSLLVSHLER
jgi:hypothetical protein